MLVTSTSVPRRTMATSSFERSSTDLHEDTDIVPFLPRRDLTEFEREALRNKYRRPLRSASITTRQHSGAVLAPVASVPVGETLHPIPSVKTGTSRTLIPDQLSGTVQWDSLFEQNLLLPPEVAPPVVEGLAGRMLLQDLGRLSHPQEILHSVVYDGGPAHSPIGPSDTALVFEARFESGNLRRAIRVTEYEYDLVLSFDVNTRGHTQWYFFSVSNMRRGVQYRFRIINLMKPDSLYNEGMLPLVFESSGPHAFRWRRSGKDVCYYQNHIRRKNGMYFYTLHFAYDCPATHSHTCGDRVYFAHCYPYTYSHLQRYLRRLELDPKRKTRFRRRTLCDTLAGNSVDLLVVTSFASDWTALQRRKGVVITARVHPGETNASWMMHGLLDYLTGPSLDAKILRDNFVFKIVPMLNPDGVIHGCYRCSLAGCDLNRRWLDPSRKLHPSVYHTKEMLKKFAEDREILVFCDLHGHSRKHNIFMYACDQPQDSPVRLHERVFPRILWRIAPQFSFKDCSFRVHRSKDSTARVVVHRDLNLVNSVTMEASFCGPSTGPHAGTHFRTKDLISMGQLLCDAILEYADPDRTQVNSIVRELELLYPPKQEFGEDEWSDDTSSEDEGDPDRRGANGGKKNRKKKKKRQSKKGKEDIKKKKPRKPKERGRRKRTNSANSTDDNDVGSITVAVRAVSEPRVIRVKHDG